jgi:tetratricopeptide (TPR) repeat protein
VTDFENADVNEGNRLLQAGQFADAARVLGVVVQREPQNGAAFGSLGIALIRIGQLNEGLNALGQASQLQPTDPAAQYNVAVGLMQANRQSEAIPFLEYTLSLAPDHQRARQMLESLKSVTPAPGPVTSESSETGEVGLAAGQSAVYSNSAPFGAQPNSSYGSSSYSAQTPISGPVIPASQPGMNFKPAEEVFEAPSTGTRLLRGLGYGALIGQYWTAWNLFWYVVWNFKDAMNAGLVLVALGCIVIFGFAGAILGLVCALTPPNLKIGMGVGVAFGLGFMALEVLLLKGGSSSLINVFFWFYTGRYVGVKTAIAVHRPVKA